MSEPDRLAELLARTKCLLLDFDGPVCSVFAGWPAPEVAESIRSELRRLGLPLGASASTTDPMKVLTSAAEASVEGGRRAELLLREAEAVCVETAEPTPHADELLGAAARAGLRVVIVSNNSEQAIRQYLERQDLSHLVAAVVGRYPDNVDLMKPNPFLVRRGLAAGGCSAYHAAFLGDSTTDVVAGTRAGVAVIAYANKPHKLSALAAADAVITDVREIAKAIPRVRPPSPTGPRAGTQGRE